MLRNFIIVALSLYAPSSSAFTNARFKSGGNRVAFAKDVSLMFEGTKATDRSLSVVLPEQPEEPVCSSSCKCRGEETVKEDDDDNVLNIEELSMSDLNTLVLKLEDQFVLPDGATLEEARHIVWDHIQQAPWGGEPCCSEYPFCPCPKL